MKSSQIVIVTAILLAAACAGIVLTDEESDAVGVGEITSVSYTDGTRTISELVDEDAISVEIVAPESPLKTENFDHWVSKSGTPYYTGSTISIGIINADDVVNGAFILTAVYKSTTVDFIVDGKVVKGGIQTPGSVTVPEDPVKADHLFQGWQYSKDGVIYTSETIDTVKDKAVGGDTFTAVFKPVVTVTWQYEDGRSVSIGDNDPATENIGAIAQPADPTFDNHIFIGWKALGTDSIAIKAGDTTTFDADKVAESVIYVAVFEAEYVTVTFMAGGEVVDTVDVRYGSTVSPIMLPEDYSGWDFDFTQAIKEPVIIEAIESAPVIPDDGYEVSFVKMVDGESIAINTITITEQNPNITVPSDNAIAVDGKEFIGWFIGTQQVDPTSYNVSNITGDMTFVAMYRDAPEPVPEEPAFYETTTGQAAIVLIVFVIVLFIAAVYMNIGGLREKFFGWKITRKD